MHKALSPLPPPFLCPGVAYNRKHVHGKGFVASTQAFNFAFTRQFYNVKKNGKAARHARSRCCAPGKLWMGSRQCLVAKKDEGLGKKKKNNNKISQALILQYSCSCELGMSLEHGKKCVPATSRVWG